MNLRARLAALEAQFSPGGNITLFMPDGRTETIALSRHDALDKVLQIVGSPSSPQAEAIRHSVAIRESHGRLGELTRAILLSPGAFTSDPEDIENYSEQGE
jgi:hypothetical protein